jgi:hypothetical protein
MEEKIKKINEEVSNLKLIYSILSDIQGLDGSSNDIMKDIGYINCKLDLINLLTSKYVKSK